MCVLWIRHDHVPPRPRHVSTHARDTRRYTQHSTGSSAVSAPCPALAHARPASQSLRVRRPLMLLFLVTRCCSISTYSAIRYRSSRILASASRTSSLFQLKGYSSLPKCLPRGSPRARGHSSTASATCVFGLPNCTLLPITRNYFLLFC